MPPETGMPSKRLMDLIANEKIKLVYNVEEPSLSNNYSWGSQSTDFETLKSDRRIFFRTMQPSKYHEGRDKSIGKQIDPPHMDSEGKFSFRGNSISAKDFLKGQFEKIEQYESGRALLGRIAGDLESNNTKEQLWFNFSNDKDVVNSFVDRKNVKDFRQINLNLWDGMIATEDGNGLNLYATHPLIQSRSTIRTGTTDRDVVGIKRGLSPFFITLAHELGHLDHRIDGSNEGEVLSNAKMPVQPNGRVREIWGNKEERRNVFSATGFSELRLRLEAGEPLRYIYQDENSTFYEPLTTVLKNTLKAEELGSSSKPEHSYNDLFPHVSGMETALNNLPERELECSAASKLSLYTKTKLLPHLYPDIVAGGSHANDQNWFPKNWKRVLKNYTQKFQGKSGYSSPPWVTSGNRKNKESQFSDMLFYIKNREEGKMANYKPGNLAPRIVENRRSYLNIVGVRSNLSFQPTAEDSEIMLSRVRAGIYNLMNPVVERNDPFTRDLFGRFYRYGGD